MANLMRTHTAEQQAINANGAHALQSYARRVAEHASHSADHGSRDRGSYNDRATSLPDSHAHASLHTPDLQSANGAEEWPTPPLPRCFIESSIATKAEYQASLRLPLAERVAAERAAAGRATQAAPTPPRPVATSTDAASAPNGERATPAMGSVTAALHCEHRTGLGTSPFRFAPGGAPPLAPPELSARLGRLEALLIELASLVRMPAEGKNIRLLEVSAEAARMLGGGRVTMCKSGKDRTSMSTTLEHGRLLHASHGMPTYEVASAVQIMRRGGVRRENVRLNTGRRLYAFNWLQQMALPEAFRPPDGSAKGGKA